MRIRRLRLLLLAAALGWPAPEAAAQKTVPPRPMAPGHTWLFPADHGSHPDFATEWWYLTGHLQDAEGSAWALQAVFFRRQIAFRTEAAPPGMEPLVLVPAHAALTDLDRKTFTVTEHVGRVFGGGAAASAGRLAVRSGGWRLEGVGEDRWLLRIPGGPFDLSLSISSEGLDAGRPVLLHGREGYSVKNPSSPPGEQSASWYYSIPRLAAGGTLTVDGDPHAVTGTLWFDHEFFTGGLFAGVTGWDWMGLRLEDGTDLMLSAVRSGGRTDVWGTLRERDGGVLNLGAGDAVMTPLESWTAPDGKASYPIRWRVWIPARGLELQVAADVAGSELDTRRSTLQRYWEGSVRVTGGIRGRRLGEGFLEMTGYAGPLIPRAGSPPNSPHPAGDAGARSGSGG